MATDLGAAVALREPHYMILPVANAVDSSVEGIVGDSANALIVSIEGKRFMDETQSRNEMTRAIMSQPNEQGYLISDVNNCMIENGHTQFGLNVENMLKRNMLYRAETLEELANQVDMDPAILKETVEKYNGYARSGKDDDFGRTLFDERSVVEKAPFYAMPCSWAVHITLGTGLAIGEDYRVLDEQGQPIPGLYATGEVAVDGGAMSDGYLAGQVLSS